MSINTLKELFTYDNWANDRVLNSALGLPDEKLDRPIEMGPGTLRETLRHIYGSARIWHERVGGLDHATLPRARDLSAVGDIRSGVCRLADLRSCWLAPLDEAAMERPVAYVGADGKPSTNILTDILLHVINHGIHHRAQVLNMFRQVGAQLPQNGADYIFMYVEDQERAAPTLDTDAIRRYSAYSSWAFDQVVTAAAGLKDDQLDREFEMGLGTLRKTLVHIHDAETWWWHNWHEGPGCAFPAPDLTLTTARLREMFRETGQRRNQFIADKTPEDLRQPIRIVIRQVKKLTFPLGVTMLQLCCHGTHHRAQAINMLRRLGATPPKVDLVAWARSQ
ncbi:MAG TPA: DinB family protein [Phycisphaerae bacterium]|nr:DinB family protein [Phycisphaerae bacterium]